jgi:hypothetical protein
MGRLVFCLIFFGWNQLYGQDTLPHFVVKNINNKVIVSWKNNYGATVTTLNIQRSTDSLKNFTSIASMLDPTNKENGYVDSKAPSPNLYYRIFVAFAGGTYTYTQSKKPTIVAITEKEKTQDSIRLVEDSVANSNTKLSTKTTPVATGFVASKTIYTGKDNNVIIHLPNALTTKYSIKFFDDQKHELFEIKKVLDPHLIIEKVNFKHAGWFYFELYVDNVLQEKHKFYIPKEGKYGIPPTELKKIQ